MNLYIWKGSNDTTTNMFSKPFAILVPSSSSFCSRSAIKFVVSSPWSTHCMKPTPNWFALQSLIQFPCNWSKNYMRTFHRTVFGCPGIRSLESFRIMPPFWTLPLPCFAAHLFKVLRLWGGAQNISCWRDLCLGSYCQSTDGCLAEGIRGSNWE